jgi:HSP20 family protein
MAIELWRPTKGLLRRSPLADLEREMDEMLGRFMRGGPGRRLEADSAGWAPPVDMIDRKTEIVLRVDLPGLDHKDIELTVKDGVLTLRGSRHGETEEKDEEHYAMERWAGAFVRTLALPQGVRDDEIDARFINGVLEIRIPKTKESTGRKIAIKVA